MAQRIQPFKRRLVNLHDMMELDGAKVPAIAAALASAAPTPRRDLATKPAEDAAGRQNATAKANPGENDAGH